MLSNKNGLVIIIIMLLGKIVALFRDIFISKVYGISYIADAYNISYILLITIFGFVGSAITNSLIPNLSRLYKNEKKKNLFLFLNNILNVFIFISIIVSFFSIIFSDYIVKILAGNLDFKTLELASKLIKISLISIVFLTLNSILNAVLRIFNFYKTPIVAAFVLNIPALIYLVFFSAYGIKGLTWSVVLGYLIQCLIQLPALYSIGFRYKFIFNLKSEYLLNIFKIMPNFIIASGVLQISVMVDNRMASNLGEGYISALSVASKVNSLIYTVFATSLLQIAYSQMAKNFNGISYENIKNILCEYSNKLFMIIFPMMTCAILLSKEIIKILFFRGNFNMNAVNISSEALTFYLMGLIFFIFRDLLNYCFYSIDLKGVPIKIGIFSVLLNILLNILLTPFLGIGGISLATTISAAVSFIILLYRLNNEFINLSFLNKFDTIKVLISTSIILVNIFVYKYNFISSNKIIFFILIFVCIIEYFILLYWFKHSEIKKEVNYENCNNGG